MTEHVMIPETNDPVTFSAQYICAVLICGGLAGMMSTIKLDDKLVL
jgi:hypothetical protein